MLSVIKAHNNLREAIETYGSQSLLALEGPEPIVKAFGVYLEAIKAEMIDMDKLQTHLEDAIAKNTEEAKP